MSLFALAEELCFFRMRVRYFFKAIHPFRKMFKFTAQIVSQTYETYRT